jgi:FdhD protein
MDTAHPAITEVRVLKVDAAGTSRSVDDVAAREEPLEIRVEGRAVAVVMRTPGHDEELAAGFLVSEGVVKHPRDILEVSQCPSINNKHGNVVDVLLGGAVVNWDSLTRHVFSASSCGLCGKTSIESVFGQFPPVTAEWSVSPKLIASLPDKLRATQETFSKTGGLHACAVFDLDGNLIVSREDVGRHNALDKLIGALVAAKTDPASGFLFVTSRASYEMVHKAAMFGAPMLAAVSAPTALAVEMAHAANLTLIGFARPGRHSVYSCAQRLID